VQYCLGTNHVKARTPDVTKGIFAALVLSTQVRSTILMSTCRSRELAGKTTPLLDQLTNSLTYSGVLCASSRLPFSVLLFSTPTAFSTSPVVVSCSVSFVLVVYVPVEFCLRVASQLFQLLLCCNVHLLTLCLGMFHARALPKGGSRIGTRFSRPSSQTRRT
jgi:hypothetical protein